MKQTCPNSSCKFSKTIKDGSFRRRSDSRVVQRFRCKSCGLRYSQATFSLEKNQNKRIINNMTFKLLGSGMSMRRIAKVLGVDKKTISRKVDYLAKKSKIKNNNFIHAKKDSVIHMQFDDLITIEHTKMKPVSISIAVDVKTRQILGLVPSQIAAFGHLAAKSRSRYGLRKSGHKRALDHLFKSISPCIKKGALVESDEHKFYPQFVKTNLIGANHVRYKGGRGCVVGQGELKKLNFDPLFCINHTCAMLRDNIKRLARKSWCTSKSIEHLKKHLEIYMCYHNFEILSG